MRKITIIYDGSSYTYRWIKTMMWAKDEFEKNRVKIEYGFLLDFLPNKYYQRCEKKRLQLALKRQYDIVFLAFHHSFSIMGKDKVYRQSFVREIRRKCNLLCWLDTADSTGSCLFDILPDVDLYFKKQVLKDTSLYTKKLYYNRIYAHFYHIKYGLIDTNMREEQTEPVIDQNLLKKIRVSWNVAFYDNDGLKKNYYFRPFSLKKEVLIRKPHSKRKIDIHYGGSNPSIYGNVVGFQRMKSLEYVQKCNKYAHPDVYKKVSREDYLEELKNSKSIISPFGWGECCLRDFEAFIYGSTLIKPSMSHCITYPDLYEDWVTYVPFKWDFSDLDDVVENIHSEKYQLIANNGQRKYEQYVSGKNAKAYFVAHLLKQLFYEETKL